MSSSRARRRGNEFKTGAIFIERENASPERDKLSRVNDLFNRLLFEDDGQHWHQADYWATPIETLATNGGDWEEFSNAKHFILSELAVADQCLRLTYVKAPSLISLKQIFINPECYRQDNKT